MLNFFKVIFNFTILFFLAVDLAYLNSFKIIIIDWSNNIYKRGVLENRPTNIDKYLNTKYYII